MSVYSNVDIKKAVENGTIVCVPYDEKHVSEASLDFTLGHYFYKQEFDAQSTVYNPFDKKDIERYFKGPLEAMPHKEWCESTAISSLTTSPKIIQSSFCVLASAFSLTRMSLSASVPKEERVKSGLVVLGGETAWQCALMLAGSIPATSTASHSRYTTSTSTRLWCYQ